jgi:hypothetical protein
MFFTYSGGDQCFNGCVNLRLHKAVVIKKRRLLIVHNNGSMRRKYIYALYQADLDSCSK